MARLQCKDIPDETVVEAVRRTPGTPVLNWRMSWDVHAELEDLVGEVPVNLFRAKVRKLIGRGLIGGCPCGCRGDFHLPEDCGDPQCCGPVEPPKVARAREKPVQYGAAVRVRP